MAKLYFLQAKAAHGIYSEWVPGSNPKPLTNDYQAGKVLPALSIGGALLTFLKAIELGLSFF